MASQLSITQNNIHQAVREWVVDSAAATAKYGPINNWDTSSITSMHGLFDALDQFPEAYSFNDDISGWDTSSVSDMQMMFRFAAAFNQDLSGWDTRNVTRLDSMFRGASAFNYDISSWNTSKVTHMQDMFKDAYAFNQDLSSWEVDNVLDMSYMFFDAISFDQELCWRPRVNNNDADVTNIFCGSGGDFKRQCLPNLRADEIIEEARQDCASPTSSPTLAFTDSPTPPPALAPTPAPTMLSTCPPGTLQCFNGGSCTSNLQGYTCHCPDGYSGTQCENAVESCGMALICRNGGVCRASIVGRYCDCPASFTGDECEIPLN